MILGNATAIAEGGVAAVAGLGVNAREVDHDRGPSDGLGVLERRGAIVAAIGGADILVCPQNLPGKNVWPTLKRVTVSIPLPKGHAACPVPRVRFAARV